MLQQWLVLINSMMAILRGPKLPSETLLSLRNTTSELFRFQSSLLVCLDFGLGVFSGPLQKLTESDPAKATILHSSIEFGNSGCIGRWGGKFEMARDKCSPVNEASKPFLADDTFTLMVLFNENGQQEFVEVLVVLRFKIVDSIVDGLEEVLFAVIRHMIKVDTCRLGICNLRRHMICCPMDELSTPDPSSSGAVHTIDSIEHLLPSCCTLCDVAIILDFPGGRQTKTTGQFGNAFAQSIELSRIDFSVFIRIYVGK